MPYYIVALATPKKGHIEGGSTEALGLEEAFADYMFTQLFMSPTEMRAVAPKIDFHPSGNKAIVRNFRKTSSFLAIFESTQEVFDDKKELVKEVIKKFPAEFDKKDRRAAGL